MPSKLLVINEWLLHDLFGENGKILQQKGIEFLSILKNGDDRIAVLRESAWLEKAYSLMEQNNIVLRRISKFLHQSILLDSRKCLFVGRLEIQPLSEEMQQIIPEQKDYYLVQTLLATSANLIVTTDVPFYEALGKLEIPAKLRDEFFKEYFS